MTRLQKSSVFTLVVGLVLAVFMVPWSLLKLQQMKSMLEQLDQDIAAVERKVFPVPVPVVAQPAPVPVEPAKPVVAAKKAEAPAPTPAAFAAAPSIRIPLKQAVSPNGKPYQGELGVSWQFYDAARSRASSGCARHPDGSTFPAVADMSMCFHRVSCSDLVLFEVNHLD